MQNNNDELKVCLECGKEFKPYNYTQKWCSNECAKHHSKIKVAKKLLEKENITIENQNQLPDINNGGSFLSWDIPTKIKTVIDGLVEQLETKMPNENNQEVTFSRSPDVNLLRKINELKNTIENLKESHNNLMTILKHKDDLIYELESKKSINKSSKTNETKLCIKCNQLKPFSEFYKHKARSDKLQVYCKSCHNIYHSKKIEPLPKGRCIYRYEQESIFEDIWNKFEKLMDGKYYSYSMVNNILKKHYPNASKETIAVTRKKYFKYAKEKKHYDFKNKSGNRKTGWMFKFTPKIIITESAKKDLSVKISNGTKKDAFPVKSSGSVDRKKTEKFWNKFKSKGR